METNTENGYHQFQIEDYHMEYSFVGRYSIHPSLPDMFLVEFLYNTSKGVRRWGNFNIPNNLSEKDRNQIIKSQVDAEISRNNK